MDSSKAQSESHAQGRGSDVVTMIPGGDFGGVRVRVRPEFLPEHSDPEANRFVFGYTIQIRNESTQTVTLESRHWVIVDGDGDRNEVNGEGVVGYQPRLEPEEEFEYSSFCPLQTRWGTMEGEYLMRLDDDSSFEARVERFFLVGPEPALSRTQ